MTQHFRVPYGKSFIEFELPRSMQGTLVDSQPLESEKDPKAAIQKSLEAPLGIPRVRNLARPGHRVCIVFTDITRSSPDHLLVPALLEELDRCGIPDEDITLLCGIGMHRPSTREEKKIILSNSIVKRYRVIDNEPQNSAALVELGITSSGVPLVVHSAAIDADLVITTGIVEPHQYAGYSGGYKTLAIGAAGEAMIEHTHSPQFIDHPGTRLGKIEGNPFQEALSEAGRRAGLSFIINVVMDSQKRILRVAAGAPEQVFKELVAFARSVYEVHITQQYDIAIGGVGYPKDSNLYQASRAPTYLFFAPTPVVKPGGVFIIPARCEEGAGSGVGEQRFLKSLRDAPDVEHILHEARRNGYPPGQQRAFVLAKVLEKNKIVVVGSEHPELVSECKMIPAATMEQALAIAEHSLGKSCQVLIVPHATQTLPVIQPASYQT